MAEIAVLLVIKKIGIAVAGETLKFAKPLIAKKAELVAALPTNMKLIKNELELIHAFLEKIGRTGSKDEVIEAWIGQVRRLAYHMEDITDQFIYIVGKHSQNMSWWVYVKKIIKKPQSLFSLDEIATEIKTINEELKRLSESRGRWTIPIDGGNDITLANYVSEQEPYLPGHDLSVKDDELVGIDKNRDTLMELLQSEDSSLRTIVVWGMGGIGKSTLVNNVYKNEVSDFECRAWVSVSQSYKMDDICRNMLREILGKEKKEFDAEKMDNAKLRSELAKILGKKRYMIILDDVWKAEDLSEIMKILVDNLMGSRVIITTRIEDVALVAEDDCQIKIEPLNDDDAWLLFCRKAFPNIENHICPPELLQCGKDIMEKCDGLPLAITTIGSLLSNKRSGRNGRLDQDWRLFCEQLISELHKEENKKLNRVEKILNLSYKYLPSHLKNCFLYCAMFPEDYLIHRKRLIRLWIAEGFIEQNGASSLEDIAEAYIRELVRRSMLQVIQRNSFNRIKCLRMHDLVRELAIFQSKKEYFGTTYDDTHGTLDVGSDSRRVSVLRCRSDIRSSIYPSRLRTFMAFDTSMAPSPWPSFIPSESKYLVVLDLSGMPVETIPDSVGQLFNLRYLCLNDTNVKNLPKSITELLNLETLILINADCLNLPQGFTNLKKLRYLRIFKRLDYAERRFISWEPMKTYEDLWNLMELRTLDGVQASKDFVAKLGNLSQLRHLCISGVRSSMCLELCHSLSKMNQLSRLEIRANNEDELLNLETLKMPNSVQKLILHGQLSDGTLESPFLSTNGNALREIHLYWCHLTENPVSRLSGLSNLTLLSLTWAYTGQQIDFHKGWYPNLKTIYLYCLPRVKEIQIHEGALVSLEDLHITGLKELRDIPIGIQFLKYIKEAYFLEMCPDFVRNIERAANLYHIANVYYSTKGVE